MIVPQIPQDQVWDVRRDIMNRIADAVLSKRPVKILEVGVWYGVGSTRIWLQKCAPGSQVFLLDAWRPYSSDKDLYEDRSWNYKAMDDMSTDAFLSAYLSTRRIEAERAHENVKVNLIRGDSESCLSAFEENSFDFIYIDGDHKYPKVKADIAHAKRLIRKDFGVICGDDLEYLPTPERYQRAIQHKDRDFLRDDKPGAEQFHPGVLAAVAEEFQQVNMANGTWWVVSQNNKFVLDAEGA